MTDPAATPAAPVPTLAAASDATIPAAIQAAARWFWWIAGLSLVNTVMAHAGSDGHFVMGLGFTTVADVIFDAQKVIAYVIDAIALGAFAVLGLQAKAGKLWAFYTGILLYAADALICLILQDWMSVGFHGLALFFLSRGAIALIAHRRQVA